MLGVFGMNAILNQSHQAESPDIAPIESKLLETYLVSPLWNSRDIYDAARTLMIPLHYAFASDDEELLDLFSEHFFRFSETLEKNPDEVDAGRLNRIGYWYLVSRFLSLAHRFDAQHLVPKNLEEQLLFDVKQLWSESPAWQWMQPAFEGGIQERLEWKLSVEQVERSFHRAIIDEELYLFAIAADMLHVCRLRDSIPSKFLEEIRDLARTVFQERVSWNEDGGWLMEPGTWTDHPTYAYAGYRSAPPSDAERMPINGIATDTSHSHRYVLWIRSLKQAYETSSAEAQYYDKLLVGMEIQFLDHVLVYPGEANCFRTTNFMDGYNGIFRWDYATCEGDGYLPFELSGTLFTGWWVLLSHRSQDLYRQIATTFPLSDECLSLYVGPNTNRDRNPLVILPDFYINGFAELLVIMGINTDLSVLF